jgi:hypothetical protein
MVSLLLLTAGCATVQDYSLTYKLWNNAELRRFAEPAPEPHLALFSNPRSEDLLVQYDEVREQDVTVRRRAYFMRQNAERISRREKPRFVDPQLASAMEPVPVCAALSETNNPALEILPLFAMFTRSDGQDFVLLRHGTAEGPYTLPAYVESNANFVRVAFTPFAVAGDTIMVGLVASIAAAYAYAAASIH